MVVVDDHLALLAVAGRLPELGASGPVATTWAFQLRLVRAMTDVGSRGSLSRREVDTDAALGRVLRPPAHRLVVLDPRASIEEAAAVAVRHGANLLLADLVGSALHHGVAVRVTSQNVGRSWPGVMSAEGVDFAAVEV